MRKLSYTVLAAIAILFAAVSLQAAALDNSALWRPRFATPVIIALDSASNRQFTAEIRSSSAAVGWSAIITNDLKAWNCQIISAQFAAANINRSTEAGWKVVIRAPADASPELFSLIISNSERICTQGQCVQVIESFATNFYVLHMADEQIVQEFHNVPSGMWYTTVGTAEEFAWEQQTINIINPRFVFITGDQIDFNGALDGYNNWSNWGYSPGGSRDFTVQETMTIEQRLADMYKSYHLGFRVPYVSCPGNHDVPPTGWQLHGSSPLIYWHAYGVTNYESNFGQRSWSFRMGDFYVLMHDWSESSLKTWANNDYTNALNDPTIKYRLIGQHYVTDQAVVPSNVSLMLIGHTHTTATYQSAPYYIYVDGPAFSYGTCGFFNFQRAGSSWICDQTTAPRNTATDVWRLFGDNGSPRKVRADQPDAMNVTATSDRKSVV